MKIIVILLMLISTIARAQEITIGGRSYTIDWEYLLDMTRLVESEGVNLKPKNVGNGNVVYGEYQLETDTTRWLNRLNKKSKKDLTKDRDMARYLYEIRIKYEMYRFDDIRAIQHLDNEDIHWALYKVFYNTHRGRTHVVRWRQKKKQLGGMTDV